MNLPKMAGVEGVEPSHTVPETAVLPLDDTPMCVAPQELDANRYIIGISYIRQERTSTFSKGGIFTPLVHLILGIRRRNESLTQDVYFFFERLFFLPFLHLQSAS